MLRNFFRVIEVGCSDSITTYVWQMETGQLMEQVHISTFLALVKVLSSIFLNSKHAIGMDNYNTHDVNQLNIFTLWDNEVSR